MLKRRNYPYENRILVYLTIFNIGGGNNIQLNIVYLQSLTNSFKKLDVERKKERKENGLLWQMWTAGSQSSIKMPLLWRFFATKRRKD